MDRLVQPEIYKDLEDFKEYGVHMKVSISILQDRATAEWYLTITDFTLEHLKTSSSMDKENMEFKTLKQKNGSFTKAIGTKENLSLQRIKQLRVLNKR
mgnify:CR=1 FL=1